MKKKRKNRYSDPRRWEVEEFKTFLGSELASQFTKTELIQLRYEMHMMAEILVDLFLENVPKLEFSPSND